MLRTYFFKKWLKIEKACLPDNIKWENLGYNLKQRLLRTTIIRLLAAALLLGAMVGIAYFKNQTEELKK